MQARLVDPRATKWEVDDPVFRVHFFQRAPGNPGVTSELVGYESEEWELTGSDVQDALSWATGHAGSDRTWILYVAGPVAEGPGLIRLAGVDPNAATTATPMG